MQKLIQFKITSPQAFLIEEGLGDLILSLSWQDSDRIVGAMYSNQIPLFEERLESLFSQLNFEVPEVHFLPLETKDWLLDQQDSLPVLEVGNIIIHGPQFSEIDQKGKITLMIDSPRAFGDGHHPTTKSCLLALQETSAPSKALDIGCGSGILAMAMASLWNIPVFACDCEEESVHLAKRNVERNQLADITIVQSDALNHSGLYQNAPYDLIIANIHSKILCDLAGEIHQALARNGVVILSGILKEQEDDVLSVYAKLGFDLFKKIEEQSWSTLILQIP